MKLNHLNLFSADIVADRAMFETYFGLRCEFAQGKAMAMLYDEGDRVMLFLNHFEQKRGDFTYPADPDIQHIGFIQSERVDVDAIHAKLKADGWEVPEPRDYHGAWTFYFQAKGGYWIEVCTATPV